MKKLMLIVIASCSLFASELADVHFGSNWTLDNGATISGDTLTIVNDGSKIVRATLNNVSVDASTETLYLVGDVHFSSDVTVGDKVYKAPRFKIYNGDDNSKISFFNITSPLLDKWYTTGVMVKRFNTFNASSLKIEVMLQNSSGTMSVTHLRLTDTPPTAIYNYPFPVPADKSCKIALNTADKRQFPTDLFSVNSHFVWASSGWEDATLRSILKTELPLRNLRFPGGTVGNFYDWQTDGFYGDEYSFKSVSRKKAYDDGFTFGFSDYASLCKEIGATSTLMFNVIEDSPSKAAQRLQNRIDAGLDIAVIEMGNENFFSDQAMGNIADVDGEASVTAYITHTKSMASALKNVDPSVQVAVNIDRHSWDGEWDSTLAQEKYYDATIVHPYVKVSGFLFGEASAKEYLSAYNKAKENLTNYQRVFGTTPLYCTEFNVLSDGIPCNFLQVLSLGDVIFALLEGNDAGIVKQMGVHMLYKNDSYSESTLYFKRNGTFKKTALAVLYEKFVTTFQGSMIYDAIGKSAEVTSGVPGIMARAVLTNDTTKIIAINKLPENAPLEITLDGKDFTGSYTIESFAGGASLLSDTTGYDLSANPWVKKSGNGTPSLPAYSVSVVTLQKGTVAINSSISPSHSTVQISQVGKMLNLTNMKDYRTVSLYSIQGRKLLTQSIDGKSDIAINTGSLSMGSYIVELKGKSSITRKIVIR